MSRPLPPRLRALAERLQETQTNALGAIEIMWRDEIAPFVADMERIDEDGPCYECCRKEIAREALIRLRSE